MLLGHRPPDGVEGVTSEEARIGIRVRVREEPRSPHVRGKSGTVTHTWGDPHYLALDVLLDDGDENLFWHHELERVREHEPVASRKKAGWRGVVLVASAPLVSAGGSSTGSVVMDAWADRRTDKNFR